MDGPCVRSGRPPVAPHQLQLIKHCFLEPLWKNWGRREGRHCLGSRGTPARAEVSPSLLLQTPYGDVEHMPVERLSENTEPGEAL